MPELKPHPAADAFPMMGEARFAELAGDIATHGQREDITLCDGKILDGRNRYKACRKLGITPKTRDFDGDPWGYVWSLNGQRRDLVEEQRYLIWKFCHEQGEAWQAKKQAIADKANKARSKASKGNKSASKEMWPCRHCGGEHPIGKNPCHDAIFTNDASTQCTTTVSEPGADAKAKASNTNKGAVKRGDALAAKHPDLASDVRLGKKKPAEAHRQAKKREVSKKVAALPKGKHTVIYADPPWSYNDAQAVKGDYGTGTGAAEGHYPSMTMTELKALDVADLAAEDSVLFLWATSPLLPESLQLAAAWGFKYKAMFIWDKVKHNMGHYNSVRHELLLICTKGSCTPQVGKLFNSVQRIERTRHSAKPKQFRTIIETLYPKGRKVELFAREKVSGWKAWGFEA